MKPAIVFLCTPKELNRERRGYFKAFSRCITTVCVPNLPEDEYESLHELVPGDLQPILFLHPDAYPRWLPKGLVASSAPTACFSIDTFEGDINSRIHFSKLFDYAFVFHPEYDRRFQIAGHPGAICLPHAVETDIFAGSELARIYDVGWVGRLDGKKYSVRRRCVQELNRRFHMNDIQRYYSPEEMALVYQQSKIVVNLSRDDYLKDANLRCFEAIAGGALLITPEPTELADLGFIKDQHYVSYQRESELYPLVQFYLEHDVERDKIAKAGRILVMNNHTYDSRAQSILKLLTDSANQPSAPARNWDTAQVHATYCRYYAESLVLDAAIDELRKVRDYSRTQAWLLLLLLTKSFIDKIKVLL